MSRLENLLGATALTLSDQIAAGDAGDAGSIGPSERAALVTLLAHPYQSVSWLAEVLGLTSSGSTRLVARMVEAGWLHTVVGTDARSRRVRLTRAGATQARRVLTGRADALADAVRALDEQERADLERLLDTVVAGLADTRLPALRTCRLCDRASCATGDAHCPLDHTVPAEPSVPTVEETR